MYIYTPIIITCTYTYMYPLVFICTCTYIPITCTYTLGLDEIQVFSYTIYCIVFLRTIDIID